MQAVLYFSTALYILFYAFESVIRYGLNLVGLDALIFVRDALIALSIVGLFAQQFFRRAVSPAFLIFFTIVAVHGFIMLANIGSIAAVVYGAKMLMTVLAGALAARELASPGKKMMALLWLVWISLLVGVVLDKFFVQFPWAGMVTRIGGVQVEISRDWEISGTDKRAAGFTRSSIHTAAMAPLIALTLFFNLRSFLLRWGVCLATLPLLYWTTQKGSLLAFLTVLGLLALSRNNSWPLRLGFVLATLLAIACPLILPQFTMPHTEGVFSMSSFYMRIEEMWPRAWDWIDRMEVVPFGVGLGGISGGQRFYALSSLNFADNIFVFFYAYFGYCTFIYLGWMVYLVLRQPARLNRASMQATAILTFFMFYGIVLSMMEDQMTSLFLGLGLGTLCHEMLRHRNEIAEEPLDETLVALPRYRESLQLTHGNA